jgi:hypothetical protein
MARDAITTYSASRVFTKKPEGLTSGYEQSFRKYPEVPTHTLLPSSWAVKIIGEPHSEDSATNESFGTFRHDRLER